MGKVPMSTPLPERLLGEVTLKLGDKVTTDHIQPSGSRMIYRSNPAEYAKYTFEIVDPTFYHRASKIRDMEKHNIIVAGAGYGQGSSREHAALCPMFLGVRAVVAKSIERIHRANLINFGIIPFTFQSGEDLEWIEQGDVLEVSYIRQAIESSNEAAIVNKTKDRTFRATINLSERERKTILAGGTIPYTKNSSS